MTNVVDEDDIIKRQDMAAVTDKAGHGIWEMPKQDQSNEMGQALLLFGFLTGSAFWLRLVHTGWRNWDWMAIA